jgi:hypothetical protein
MGTTAIQEKRADAQVRQRADIHLHAGKVFRPGGVDIKTRQRTSASR